MKVNAEAFQMESIKIKIIYFTLFFSTLLMFDILLGVQLSEEQIEDKAYKELQTGTVKNRGKRTVIGIVTNKSEYPFRNPTFYNEARKGDILLVSKSKIFGEVTKIKYKNIEYENAVFSIYAICYLFPIICFTSSIGGFILYRFKSSHFDFFLVLSSIITIYLIISMVTNNNI